MGVVEAEEEERCSAIRCSESPGQTTVSKTNYNFFII